MCRKQLEIDDKCAAFMFFEAKRQGITQAELVEKALKSYQKLCRRAAVMRERRGY